MDLVAFEVFLGKPSDAKSLIHPLGWNKISPLRVELTP
jgi:hypothetical protein